MDDIFSDAFSIHREVVEESAKKILPEILHAAELLFKAVKENRQLLVCGNGGSAADAQHLVAEWVCRYKDDRRPLRAVALTTNTSAITAISNDYGFDEVFSRQIEALGDAGDVLVAITTSGKSPNIIRAIEEAKKRGLKVIALTGEGGAVLNEKVDAAIIVPSKETARIQEVHELIYHVWCEFLDSQFSEN